jgi:alkylation response protein AidB-like acyl-CoA dehydrogenase
MLVEMLGEVTAMQLYCIRLGRLIDDGKMNDTMASLAKYVCTAKARNVCRMARDILGGKGILLDFHAIRARPTHRPLCNRAVCSEAWTSEPSPKRRRTRLGVRRP